MKKHLYIVSFGNSREYRLFVEPSGENEARDLSEFTHFEKRINDYLAGKFPGVGTSYYSEPTIREIPASEEDKYATYPLFNKEAEHEIREELVREVQVMNADRELNSNDPLGIHAEPQSTPK